MQTVLLIIQLLVAIALIIVILLQRSEGGALGIGGSGSGLGGLFSARGAADTLTRTTAVLGVTFFAISVLLNVLSLRNQQGQSVLDSTAAGQTAPVQHAPAPAPAAPSPMPQLPSVPPSR